MPCWGFPWILKDSQRFSRILKDSKEFLQDYWTSFDGFGWFNLHSLRFSGGFYGILGDFMGFFGILGWFLGDFSTGVFLGDSETSSGDFRPLQDSPGIPKILPGFLYRIEWIGWPTSKDPLGGSSRRIPARDPGRILQFSKESFTSISTFEWSHRQIHPADWLSQTDPPGSLKSSQIHQNPLKSFKILQNPPWNLQNDPERSRTILKSQLCNE